MEIKLLNNDVIFGLIENRIVDGWLLVSGPMNALRNLEFEVYPPNTSENKNFEMLNMSIAGKIDFRAIVKKTDRLRKALGDDKDFDKFIMLHFIDEEGMYGAYRTIVMKYPGPKNGFRSFVREQLFDFFKILEETAENGSSLDMSDDELWEYFKGLNKKKPAKTKRKTVSKSIRHEVFKRDDYTCLECGATKDDTRLHIDHILPVSQGGTDELVNLQVLCEACNLAKSSRRWKGGE